MPTGFVRERPTVQALRGTCADVCERSLRYVRVVTDRPAIVCLCGSTRFREAFADAGRAESLAGRIVVRPEIFSQSDGLVLDEESVRRLGELHRFKIELADELLIIDVDGYVGPATQDEVAYAQKLGKPVRYWSQA